MAERGSLIPEWAKKELAESDARREAARRKPMDFNKTFAKTHAYEWELATEWGCCAETVRSGGYETVTRTLTQMYPPRKINFFVKWLSRLRYKGRRIFVPSPSKAIKGFKFLGKRYRG